MKRIAFVCLLTLLGPALFGLQTGGEEEVRSAMKDITTIATGLADYFADNGAFPIQVGAYNESSVFFKALVPKYLKSMPTKDPWGNDYLVYCGKPFDGVYGLKGTMADDMLIVSYGQDNAQDDWRYDPGNLEAGLYDLAETNYDLVMYNGTWIRAPRPWGELR